MASLLNSMRPSRENIGMLCCPKYLPPAKQINVMDVGAKPTRATCCVAVAGGLGWGWGTNSVVCVAR